MQKGVSQEEKGQFPSQERRRRGEVPAMLQAGIPVFASLVKMEKPSLQMVTTANKSASVPLLAEARADRVGADGRTVLTIFS